MTASSTPADLRIVRAAQGDRAALESLLGDMLPRVRNLVRYLTRSDADVDDVAQNALLAIAKGLHTYRGEGAFSAWCDRVIARVTFAEIRARERQRAQTVHRDADLIAAGPPQTGEAYLRRREAVKMLDELPDDQRHALVLHFVLGMTVPEIAEELAVPDETVRSRLRLGREKLREAHDGSGSKAVAS